MLITFIVIYFLCAIYFAQHTWFCYEHDTYQDKVLEYLIAVFWVPAFLCALVSHFWKHSK